VQLDKTRIAVRERSVFDTLDLALHVFRIHAGPLCSTMFLLAAPLAIVNHLLLGWMLNVDLDAPDSAAQIGGHIRYAWTMLILVAMEAPLASALTTLYLGQALFAERPRIGDAVRDLWTMLPLWAWYQLCLRGVLPAILLVMVIDRQAAFTGTEVLLVLLFLAVLLRRAVAPFLNEIILLERNPMRSTLPNAITVRSRGIMLHGPAGGSLVVLALVTCLAALLLVCGLFGTFLCLQGVIFNNWETGVGLRIVGWPVALWLTATYCTVVRFLSYLDVRIRQEGWEVELRMRAEAHRLAGLV